MEIRRKGVWETWRSYFQYVYREIISAYEPLDREVDKLRAQVVELGGDVSRLRTRMKEHLHICPNCGAIYNYETLRYIDGSSELIPPHRGD